MKATTDSPTSHLALLQSATAGAERHMDENAPERCLGMPQPVQTASFAAKAGGFYPVDPTAGALVVTLPPAGAIGDKVTIKNLSASANTITVQPQAGDTINTVDYASFSAAGAWAICIRINRRAWAWLLGVG